MTAVAPAGLWRPYHPDDEPLFTPDLLLGFDSMDLGEQARLTAYLTALVMRRGVVHTSVAFNAVYFGYDLDFGGYVGGPLELDTFCPIATGESGPALPVGAMVSVAAGADPLYAEVVYKDGAHADVRDDGDVPSWLSGAPAGAAAPGQTPSVDGQPVLRERLVLDFDAFGADLAATPTKLARLAQRGRLLDASGHVLRDAVYPDADAAEASDVDFYARYLLTDARDQLLGGPLPLLLTGDAGEPELAAALAAGLAAVGDALAACPALRVWNGYAFTRAGFAARLRDSGVLGRADLDSLVNTLARSPAPARSARYASTASSTRYTAVGPLLAGVRDAAAQLQGLRYPAAIVHASTLLADYVHGELGEDGLLGTGVHLRLDDAWQSGGVWRSTIAPGREVHVEPLSPLALGWAATLPLPANPEPEPQPDPEPQPQPDPEQQPQPEPESQPQPDPDPEDGLGRGEVLSIDDSHVRWSAPLRLKHLLDGTLPVPAAVAALFVEHDRVGLPMRLALTHAGYELDPADAMQAVAVIGGTDTPMYLTGVSWPLEFFAGLKLEVIWPLGASIVRASTTLRPAGVDVDGVTYEHEFDPRVLTRDTAPGAPPRARGQGGTPQPLTLKDRVLRAVRHAGLLDVDGVAVLRRDRLAALVFGDGAGPAEAASGSLDPVVTDLLISGVLTLEYLTEAAPGVGVRWPKPDRIAVGTRLVEALLWRPATPVPRPGYRRPGNGPVGSGSPGQQLRPKHTAPPAQPTPPALEPAWPVSRYLSAYTVASFLRRLPPGWTASEEKDAEYRALTARFGRPRGLPPGYTLVTGHERHR